MREIRGGSIDSTNRLGYTRRVEYKPEAELSFKEYSINSRSTMRISNLPPMLLFLQGFQSTPAPLLRDPMLP